ncbi:hypothetical protein CRYUN_Cryun26dG0001500 [Craigia yunnanensis]
MYFLFKLAKEVIINCLQERIPIEEVFEQLNCSREGLTTEEGTNRLQVFGPNKLEEKKEKQFLKFLGFMWNPLSWVMEAAAIMAIALENGGGRPMDWQDFIGIIVLLLINSTISFIEENNAGNAAAALMANLAPKTKEVPEKTKESPGAPWQLIGLLPLFDSPRHDSAETIRRALNLGVNVKMITGDQLAIAKETGRGLGMGTNMYPSSSLLGQDKDASIAALPIDELIEKADGFAGVFPEHKYEIVKRLQERKLICDMTGDGVNDAPALKKADIGIDVADAQDATRSASDIVLTEPGLCVIISAVLTSRAIFQRMKNYTIYAVSITIRIVFGFMFIALIWKFDFAPFMVLIIAILNDGTIMTISKDRVKPSPQPDSWKHKEIFTTGVVLGGYLALMTAILQGNERHQFLLTLYLQVSIVSQALIFVTRSRSWSYFERPGLLLVSAFIVAQLTAFTTKKDYVKEERETQWAAAQRTLHGLQPPEASNLFNERSSYRELSEIAEQAKRRAEVARLRELNTLKGHVESVVKLKGLDIDTIQQHYTV